MKVIRRVHMHYIILFAAIYLFLGPLHSFDFAGILGAYLLGFTAFMIYDDIIESLRSGRF